MDKFFSAISVSFLMRTYLQSLKSAWLEGHTPNRRFINLALTIFLVTWLMLSFATYLRFIESRPGSLIDDPILALFKPIDLTWPIFIVTYPSLIIGLLLLLKKPDRFIIAFQAYGIMMLMRMLMMYTIPLEPPEDTIPLVDPFVENAGKTGFVPTKDLFFSGHTGSMFMVFINMVTPVAKFVFFLVTCFIGTAVILQKVHYTIDVAVAPFIAYCCLTAVRNLKSKVQSWY